MRRLKVGSADAFRAIFFGAVLILVSPVPAHAQRKLWGVTASFAPVWQTEGFSKHLNGADEMNFEGQALRVGVSRGGTVGGDWSLLFVRRHLKAGGVLVQDGRYVTNDDVVLNGFEAEGFLVGGSIKDRVLFGVVIAGGLAVVGGTMTASDGSIVDAGDVLTLWGTGVNIQPLARLEFAVGFVVARGFRIRASGGFDWPGLSGSVAATYFFGDR